MNPIQGHGVCAAALVLLVWTSGAQAAPQVSLPPRTLAPAQPTPDCNGNGVPDPIDIATGSSADCQGDRIPDECQLATAFSYHYDDGGFDGAVGTNHDHIAWLTNFTVQPGYETITGVELEWGTMPDGWPATIAVWDDPNGDGDPADSQALVTVPVVSTSSWTGVLVLEDIPDTFVGPAGTSFFVGVFGQFNQTDFPAILDNDSTVRKSWWIASDTPIQPDNLTGGALAEYGLIGSLCACDGDWTLRGIACPTGHCGESADVNGNGVPDECEPDCNGNGIPDDYEISLGLASDCDGNGVPDDCQDLEDCDENRVPDICQALTPEGLVGEYFPNRFLQGEPMSRIDSDVVFDFDSTPPFPGYIQNDDFGVRWTGSFTTLTTGTYTFGVLHDDGARLWVNGALLIDEWHSSAGDFDIGTIDLAGATEYHLRLEYYEGSAQALVELHWQPPGGVMQPMLPSELRPIYDRGHDGIPDSCQLPDCNGNGVEDSGDIAFGNSMDCDGNGVPDECQPCEDADSNGLLDSCELGAGNGLVAQYFESEGDPGGFGRRLAVQVDPNVDFDWGSGAPAPGLPHDDFTVRWTGTLTAAALTGSYGLHVQSDDGVRFWLDGNLLVDEWHASGGNEYTVDLPLVGGSEHLIELEYYEGGGDALVHLRWTEPGGTKVPIPTSALTPDTDLDGDGVPDLGTADCNLNGIPDALEADGNGNCVPDDCEGGAGYWRFEEAGGNAIVDATSNGLDGLLNGIAYRVDDVPVDTIPSSGAPNFQSLFINRISNTSGGLASVADTGGFLSMGSSDFTLEAWVELDELGNTSSADQRQWLFQKKPFASSDAQLDYGFLVQAGPGGSSGRELAFLCGDGSAVHTVVSSLSIDDLDWHFVSLAYDAGERVLRFGLDQTFEIVSFTKPSLVNSGDLQIGAHENQAAVSNQYLRGTIDEARVTRVLLAPELLLDSN